MSTLYLVATPIGNRDDFSKRALDVLKSVDSIACEDTRTSQKLFEYYGISKPVFAFHQHNEHSKVNQLIEMLDQQKQIALITDAGMPGISDPGFLAVRAAHQQKHSVQVIPGPDAATTALVASGLPCDRYIFEGFLPHKKGRQGRIKALLGEERTVVLFESPHRILRLLDELATHLDTQRYAAVCKELTKQFEHIERGPVGNLSENLQANTAIKGEFVVVIAGCKYSE